MSAITRRAPMRLASSADMMFASSSLVTETKRSVSSTFSSPSRSSLLTSPCSTSVEASCPASTSQRRFEDSITFTLSRPSSARASRRPMLPPPAMITRSTGRSTWRMWDITSRMFSEAATKNTSSPACTTVSGASGIAWSLR